MRLMRWGLSGVALLGAVAAGVWLAMRALEPAPLSERAFADRYATPLPPPEGPLAVYHLGHSLVGRDMPVMLDQLAGAGHSHASQLGWGTSLKDHATGSVNGFAEENAHPRFRPAAEALASGDYDAVVLTEMVEIRDAIRYHDSGRYLAHWAAAAHKARPDARVYLYETWHDLKDADGWLERIDADQPRYWEGELLRRAMALPEAGTIYVIPGGPALAAVVRAAEAGEIPGLLRREELFLPGDGIHLNDIGAYVIALAHYAVLYGRSPVGLPAALRKADGTPATALSPEAALRVQEVVWGVITRYPPTGVQG
jgi:hypothetical protein